MTTEHIELIVRHRIPGRLRFAATADDFERASAVLATLPGVTSVEARQASGSIVVRHSGPLEDHTLIDAGFDVIAPASPAPAAPADPIGTAMAGLSRLDRTVKFATDGQLDLWGLAFGGLVAGGVIQLMRGRFAGPALALFGQAATLAMAKPLRRMFP